MALIEQHFNTLFMVIHVIVYDAILMHQKTYYMQANFICADCNVFDGYTSQSMLAVHKCDYTLSSLCATQAQARIIFFFHSHPICLVNIRLTMNTKIG